MCRPIHVSANSSVFTPRIENIAFFASPINTNYQPLSLSSSGYEFICLRVVSSSSVEDRLMTMREVDMTSQDSLSCIPHEGKETKYSVPSMEERSCSEGWNDADVKSLDLDSSSHYGKSVTNESDSPIVTEISKKATKKVFHLKLLLLLILLVSASSLAGFAFMYIKRSETKQFESKFGYDTNKVFQAVGSSLDRTLGLLDSLAVTLVSYAKDKNDKWPFVTLPDFGPRMAKLLPLTDAFTVNVLPIVYPEQRKKWEEYSVLNDEWVNQSISIQETWDGYFGPIVHDWEQYGIIHGDFGDIESNVSRTMLPQWQNFPVIPEVVAAYNWDWGSISAPEALYACIDTLEAVISDTYMVPNPDDPLSQAESEGWVEWLQDYINPSDNAFEPVVDVYYPIINDLSQVDISNDSDNIVTNKTIVGIIAVSIYWRELIRDILPPGSNGITIVVQSPCNLPFTYQFHGPDIKYLGVGDNHDAKYDDLVRESKLVELNSFALRAGTYTGARINVDVCPYTLHLYPSDTMKMDFTSQTAVVALVLVLVIFAFTSFVFYLYDWTVERRQDKVMSSAMRSSAIVDSLFPSTVRNQLYEAQNETKPKNLHGSDNMGEDLSTTSGLLNGSGLSQFVNQGSIAQVYPDTTVIFADIVGFTSWSSTREPTQVFHLLETLYAAFDSLAKLYGVFKIETIGDSYVAVVGLPKARKGHAVIMAKFANDCQSRMMELVQELEGFLGPGTSQLALRIGLNSGPTTAGVLRGEKARFQLFGDTVNTAARMESNGAPNKIHVSATTAELIKLAGKRDWLVPRDEPIFAKGKGLMQTYWCEPSMSYTNSEASN